MALAVAAAAAYATASGKLEEPWHIGAAILAALTALLWGGYYATLRCSITADALCLRYLWVKHTLRWSDLLQAEAYEQEAQSIASCKILLTFTKKSICISSELYPLEEVQEFCRELTCAGYLQAKKPLAD